MRILDKTILAVSLVTGLFLFEGCNIYKKFDISKEVGDNALLQEYVKAADQTATEGALGTLTWQTVYTDPVLAGYIQRALDNNVDLANARLNIEVAHANMKGARMSFLPSAALAPNGALASYAHSDFSKTYQIPLALSWEVDAFGKLLNAKRGAEATYAMSQDYEQAVRSQIIAAVANCYYAISALKAQIELTQETAEVWKANVQTMKDYKEAGRTNEAAVTQSEASYYSICASLSELQISLNETMNTFSLLMNEMPHAWDIQSGLILEMPEAIREGVPMVELANRPDVRAAERNLAVAYYATNSARAAFYPTLTLTANLGGTNLLGSIIKNPAQWFTQLAGSLTVPLFSRGQNIAKLEATKAQQEQVLNTFGYTLISAAADVNEAMTTIERNREKSQWLEKQVNAWQQSVKYTDELFYYGSATYLEVLTAQNGLLSARMSYISCNLARTQGIISLYQSLGGGGIATTERTDTNNMN